MDIKTLSIPEKLRINPAFTLLLLILVTVSQNICCGEDRGNDTLSIQIGQPIPDLVFETVHNSARRVFSTRALGGLPTVLYFFSTACKVSFPHLSEIDRMYSAHKDSFNLLLVGADVKDMRGVYEAYQKKYDLDMPITYDKVVYKRYGIKAFPNVVWIKKDGTVQAITNVLDHGYLKQFIKGDQFQFISYSKAGRAILRSFNADEPFLLNGNGGREGEFIQRSLLAEWRAGMPENMPWAEPNKNPLDGLKFLQAIGRELADLYRIAYFGKTYAWHPHDSAYGNYHYSPVLEIKDKSRFESDYSLGKNLFCYSQILPPGKRNPTQMMEVMRRDLKNFFGYDALVETRMMPYLSLVATDKAKRTLPTKGGTGKSSISLININLINKPVFNLISLLAYDLSLVTNDLPIIDETGITGNIDIELQTITTDLKEVEHALQKQGLHLIRKEKPMKVIVVKEPTF